MQHLESATLEPESAQTWCQVLQGDLFAGLLERWKGGERQTMPGSPEMANKLLSCGVAALPTR